MSLRVPFAAVVCALLIQTASAQNTQHWQDVNGGVDIKNSNSGNVGIGTNPQVPLHVLGDTMIQLGDLRLRHDNDSIRFAASSGSNSPMIEMFETGTENADRMVLAHSPDHPSWGLEYRDSTDTFDFVAGGASVFTIDLDSPRLRSYADLLFRTDTNSIVFSTSHGTNDAMIHMFASGTNNADRMVLSHSPSFPSWGLQYRDSSDEFRFLGNGQSALTVELLQREVGIRTDNPVAALQVGVGGDGSSALANSWNVFSSRDYKTNIVELDEADYSDALDKVVSTPLFRYHYKDQDGTLPARIGLIVEESPEEMLAPEIQIDNETKAVDLTRYIGMLHAALKAQHDRIETLESRQDSTEQLHAQLDRLSREIELLRTETQRP